MADTGGPPKTLADANIVHCDFSRSQPGAGGFQLTGSVYLNRGRVKFDDGYHLDFHLKSCEIEVSCVNCELDTTSLAFSVQNREVRKEKVTSEADTTAKAKDTLALNGTVTGEISETAQKGSLTAKVEKGRSREKAEEQKQRRSMEAEERECRSTTLLSKSPTAATWRLLPDRLATEAENGAPAGTLFGEYMKSADGSLAAVKFPDRPLDQVDQPHRALAVTVSFMPADIEWLPIPRQPEPGIVGTAKSWIANIREPSPRGLVARLKLAKSVQQSILVKEV